MPALWMTSFDRHGAISKRMDSFAILSLLWEARGRHSPGHRRSPGLYDPRFEHDACGVGFAGRAGRARPAPACCPLALTALARLAHRGAVDADGRTGDGAGVITQVPHAVLRPALEAQGHAARARAGPGRRPALPAPRARGRGGARAGAWPRTPWPPRASACLGWRDVPVREEALGEKARAARARIAAAPRGCAARGRHRRRLRAPPLPRPARDGASARSATGLDELYVASLSHRTLVYKALVARPRPGRPSSPTSAIRPSPPRSRSSTSASAPTPLPSWAMAQPFRLLAHNGEINTVQGNRRWMQARRRLAATGSAPPASPALTTGERLGQPRRGARPAPPRRAADLLHGDEPC